MIYLSAGHYQENPGATFQGFAEYEEAQRWVDLIAGFMGERDSLIVPASSIKEKVAFINARKPLAALELHFNSDETGKAKGSETLYHPDSISGKKLATDIQKSIGSFFKPDRGIKAGYYRLNPNLGVDFFLEKTSCPSVIIEPEFIYNVDLIIENRIEACSIISESLKSSLKWLRENASKRIN